jgi:hypothetical protein
MSEKEARERAGRLREVNRASTASATRTPSIGAKAQGTLQGILRGSKKAIPNAFDDVKPHMKPQAKAVGGTLPGVTGRRDIYLNGGGLPCRFKSART